MARKNLTRVVELWNETESIIIIVAYDFKRYTSNSGFNVIIIGSTLKIQVLIDKIILKIVNYEQGDM